MTAQNQVPTGEHRSPARWPSVRLHAGVGAVGIVVLAWHASAVQWDGLVTSDRGVWRALALWALVAGAIGGVAEGAVTRWVHRWAGAAVFVLIAGVGIWMPILLSGSWGGNFNFDGQKDLGSSSILGNGIIGWSLFLVLQFATARMLTSPGDAHGTNGLSVAMKTSP